MAIAYDTSGFNNAGTGDTSSVNITASGSDRKAIIFVWGDFNVDPNTTVGGSSTGVNEITRVTLTGNQKMIAYYYDNPPTSSTAYAVTETGSFPEIHVLTYNGCATGAVDSFNTGTDLTSPLDLSTTVVATGCWLVTCARDYVSGAITASTGVTQRNAGAGFKSGDSNGTVGTGSQTQSWTYTGDAGGIIVSIAPTSGGGGATTGQFLSSLGVG